MNGTKNRPVFELGVYDDVSNEDYHASEAIGHSSMVKVIENPWKYEILSRQHVPPTPAMEFGTAAHWYFMQMDEFVKNIAVQPADIKQRRGKAWMRSRQRARARSY